MNTPSNPKEQDSKHALLWLADAVDLDNTEDTRAFATLVAALSEWVGR
jgi:hypothetical protein